MRAIPLLLSAALLAGAAVPAQAQPANDPLEGVNRRVFEFNEALDRKVLKPVATGYRDVVPSPVRTAVSNFIGNFGDAWSAINQFLQGKPADGIHMTMRVAVNTVLGIGGLVDWGTEVGLERKSEDFGQTLGRWGLPAGPYLVLPLLGSSSLRDTAGLPLDLRTTPSAVLFSEGADIAAASSLQVVQRRSELLEAGQLVEDIALDKYQFLRDAYLSRRNNLVWDGNPPEDRDGDEDEDAEPEQGPGSGQAPPQGSAAQEPPLQRPPAQAPAR